MAKIIYILTILSFAFGAFFWADTHYAKCAELKSLEKRVNLAETGTILNQKQARLWAYEDRYGKDPAKIPDPITRQEMKQLQVDIPALRGKMDALEK
jgi:hypothetical protein